MTVDELIAALEALPQSARHAPVWARDVHGNLVPVVIHGVGQWNTDAGTVVGIEGFAPF